MTQPWNYAQVESNPYALRVKLTTEYDAGNSTADGNCQSRISFDDVLFSAHHQEAYARVHSSVQHSRRR